MLLVSDIHFGSNIEEDVQAFLKDAEDPAINPEGIVVIAGDITQTAKDEEFRQAEGFIHKLIQADLKLVYTPGNHDFGDWIGEYLRTNKRAREWTTVLLRPIFSQKEAVATADYDSILKIGSNIFVVLRSTHRGEVEKFGFLGFNRITGKQIEWAHSQLSAMDIDGCKLHLVTHRSIWRESGDRHSGMIKRRRLEDSLLKHFSLHTFIHGHNHRFVFAHTSTPKLGIPILRLALPTLSTRNKNWQAGYVRWNAPYERPPKLIERWPSGG